MSDTKYAIIEFFLTPIIMVGYTIFVIGVTILTISTIITAIGSSIIKNVKLFLEKSQNDN